MTDEQLYYLILLLKQVRHNNPAWDKVHNNTLADLKRIYEDFAKREIVHIAVHRLPRITGKTEAIGLERP